MPLELQAKLLRVLQEREVTRLGGREVIKVDCRIIAATNQSLDRAVKQSRFREDLFFRLNVVPIQVPPLRERRSDIPELIAFFLAKINREMGTSIAALSPDARDLLIRHNWPGNVRELENTLVRAAVLAAGPTLMPRDLALATQEPHAGGLRRHVARGDRAPQAEGVLPPDRRRRAVRPLRRSSSSASSGR